jgi:hypothetical protein
MSKDQEFTLKIKRTITAVIEVPLFAKDYDAAMKKGEKEVEKDNFDFSGGVTTIGKAVFYGLHKVKRFALFCDWSPKNDPKASFTIADLFINKGNKEKDDLALIYGRDIKKDVEVLDVGECTFWDEPFNGKVCCLRVS